MRFSQQHPRKSVNRFFLKKFLLFIEVVVSAKFVQ